jgi:hypothetical protein
LVAGRCPHTISGLRNHDIDLRLRAGEEIDLSEDSWPRY